VLRDMLASGGGGRVPSVVYTALMQEHLAVGEWEEALEVFATMTAGAKTLTVHTYNLFLAALQAGYAHMYPLFEGLRGFAGTVSPVLLPLLRELAATVRSTVAGAPKRNDSVSWHSAYPHKRLFGSSLI
jgi:pentatricopeptide repeat protein